MKLTCAGAGRTITGSCHHLEAGASRVLVDCGLFQGGAELQARNREPFPFDAAGLDAVLITHGHLDHVGRLPLLVAAGYRGLFHCAGATPEVTAIILRDSAKIHEEDHLRALRKAVRAGRENELEGPLYTVADAERAIERLVSVPMGQRFQAADGVFATFRAAGHILGSAYLELEAQGGRITFSGDLGNRDSVLQAPAVTPESCDVLVIESTYADRNHRSQAGSVAEFREVLGESLRRGGNVLIPSFAVERTQQVLYQLFTARRDGVISGAPIYLDSPMATQVTKLYQRESNEFRPEVTELQRRGIDPFHPEGLQFTVTPEESKLVNAITGGAVIIAGSGMMTGGRIVHHLKHNLWREAASLVVVGYQAEGTLGRALVDGAKRVRINGEEVAVRASLHTINGFSAHADHDDLLDFVARSKAPRVVLVHGEPKVMDGFAEELGVAGKRVDTPSIGETLSL